MNKEIKGIYTKYYNSQGDICEIGFHTNEPSIIYLSLKYYDIDTLLIDYDNNQLSISKKVNNNDKKLDRK